MPTITIHANESGDTGRPTLTERVAATHLLDAHYAAQLLDRLTWATIDAEHLEATSGNADTDESDGAGPRAGSEGAATVPRVRGSRSYTLPRVSYHGTRT